MLLFRLLVTVNLFCVTARGQQIIFGNYSVADGLPSSMVCAIVQDDQGFMWFGTRNGLSRFDGYQFKTFKFDKNQPGSIGNNFIPCMARYDSMHLWVGTEDGVYILDLEKENFTHADFAKGETISDIFKDNTGKVWVATRFFGLYLYDPATKKSIHYTANDTRTSSSISSNQLSDMAQDEAGRVWIATLGAGVDIYDPATGRFANIRAGASGLSSDMVNTIYRALNGTMWVGTMNGGLCQWQKDKQVFKTYRTGGANAIRDNIIRVIYQNTPDKLYVGTEKGLNILYTADDKFVAHTNKINDPFGISDNAVYSICLDRAGTMWLGTWFGGVSYFNAHGSMFELYYPNDNEGALHGRAVSCFLEDQPGKFWVGTEDGGLYYFNAGDKTFSAYPFKAGQEKLSYHNVHCLLKDKKGNIWIGMFAGGLNVLNPTTGKITRYIHQWGNSSSLSSNLVFSLYEDRDGTVWVGTDRGINRFNPATNSFSMAGQEMIDNSMVYDMYEDNNKTIWVTTYTNHTNGLMLYNKKTGQWSTIKTAPGSPLSSNKVVCLHDDNAGSMWIGTDGGGLNRYHIKTGQVQLYDSKMGISANAIYGIQEDDNGLLWVTSNNGIYSLNAQTGKVKHFTRQDNLQSQQFNYKAFYKASDGRLFAGGIKGFNAFYPDSAQEVKPVAGIAFTNFQLFNKDVAVADETSPVTKQPGYTKQITLAHDQSVFSFEFAALNAITPEKVKYAYKMEGFDPDWNYVGGQRKATYTNLSHGTYLFRVKATTDESNWDVPEKTMTVVITPPFYKTTLAYIIYLLLALGLLYGAYKYSSYYIRKQNEIKLERIKNKEEQEFYARKIEFFTVMAHEIRTPLSLIIAPLEKLLTLSKWNQPEKEQLKTMDENADRLLNLVNQLLDFRRIESDAYEIKKEDVEIVSLVQAIYSRFSSNPYQKNINFTMSTNISSQRLYADPEVLNKILSNLLINAFKFARTMVKISINELLASATRERMLCISVEDDGIGIPSGDIKNIFRKFFTTTSGNHQYHNLGGTGIGLALASSLAERHDGNLLVESREGVKTIFTLELPYAEEKKIDAGLVDAEEDETGAEGNSHPLILVVEDDEGIQSFLAKSLKADGYQIKKAGNGRQALQLMEEVNIDLVVSDIMMPVMDGFAFCRAVKTNINFSHIPLVLLTARGNLDAEIEGIETGADAYLMKPFKWKHVAAVIKNLLHSRDLLKLKFSEQPNSEVSVLTTNARDKEFMEKMVKIISERIMDPQLSVEELSRNMAMSRSSLHKKLKSLSGYVPNELIKLVRLKQAAKLLQLNEHSIADIAYMTGFSSHSYFSKCFQLQFRLTPKEFVDNTQKNARENKNELIDEDEGWG